MNIYKKDSSLKKNYINIRTNISIGIMKSNK